MTEFTDVINLLVYESKYATISCSVKIAQRISQIVSCYEALSRAIIGDRTIIRRHLSIELGPTLVEEATDETTVRYVSGVTWNEDIRLSWRCFGL